MTTGAAKDRVLEKGDGRCDEVVSDDEYETAVGLAPNALRISSDARGGASQAAQAQADFIEVAEESRT